MGKNALLPRILYEDNHLIAVHKPPGMLSQGDSSGDRSIGDWVEDYIRTTYNKPGNVYVGLLHRLDRPVGGVMLFAKTSKAASRMSAQFKSRKIEKVYHAIVVAPPASPQGELTHYLGMVPGKNIAKAFSQPGGDRKKATLEYQLLRKSKGMAMLEVRPHTGRKHQIRVQLSHMGSGIVGDVKYAKTDFMPDKSICLMAKALKFQHPVRKEEVILIQTEAENIWPWNLFS